MVKRGFILYLSLLTSYSFATTVNIDKNQENQENTALEESEKNIFLLERLYESIAQKCDQEKIDEFNEKIVIALKNYISSCLKNMYHVANIDAIKTTTGELLEYLLSEVSEDEAYALASVLFMIDWSQLINQVASQVEGQTLENLKLAAEMINRFIQEFFLSPMSQRIKEIKDQAEQTETI